MNEISNYERQIRNYVNDNNLYDKYFKTHLDEWMTLCVAMDTLRDSCWALNCYETTGFGNETGEKYLRLYGMLQSVILQQDSVRYLSRIITRQEIQNQPGTAWKEIRDLRNLTVGHPIETGYKGKKIKRCNISQVTISDIGFQLVIWDKTTKQDGIEDIDLMHLFNEYKRETTEHLKFIIQAQFNRNWYE